MKQSQAGNAVMFILVAIALFGALAYTFMKGSRSSQSGLSNQQATLAAEEIINYGALIERGVDKLRIKGCAEKQISVEMSSTDGYQNPDAPSDKSCNVFDGNGGGVSPQTPNVSWYDPAQKSNVLFGKYYFPSQTNYVEPTVVDTNRNDIIFIVPYIKLEVCTAILKILGRSTTPSLELSHGWNTVNSKYIGVTSTGGISLQQSYVSGCITGNNAGTTPASGTYSYYHIILNR